MVAWSVRTPDQKVQALFPFKRFLQSVTSLESLMLTRPQISSGAEIQKLKDARYGTMCYVTRGSRAQATRYHGRFNFEEGSTEEFLTTKDMDRFGKTSFEFNMLMRIAREETGSEVPPNRMLKWIGNWVAQSRSRMWDRILVSCYFTS